MQKILNFSIFLIIPLMMVLSFQNCSEMSAGISRLDSNSTTDPLAPAEEEFLTEDLSEDPAVMDPNVVSPVGHSFALVQDTNQLGSIFRVNLNTGERTVLTSAQIGSGPALSGITGIAVDPENNRAVVIDNGALGDGTMSIIQIDLTNGDRTLISGPQQGAGAQFDIPIGISFDSDSSNVLVGEAGFMNNGTFQGLVRVNLQTGDRSVVSSSNSQPAVGAGNYLRPHGVALNVDGTIYYVVDNYAFVTQVDLATGNRTVISGGVAGTGPAFNTVFDLAVNRSAGLAYVVDVSGPTIFEVDLANGNRTIISSPTVGSGPLMVRPRGITFSEEANELYITDLDNIKKIDLATGVRSVVSDTAMGGGDPWQSVVWLATY